MSKHLTELRDRLVVERDAVDQEVAPLQARADALRAQIAPLEAELRGINGQIKKVKQERSYSDLQTSLVGLGRIIRPTPTHTLQAEPGTVEATPTP